MKHYITYGLLMAVAGAVLGLVGVLIGVGGPGQNMVLGLLLGLVGMLIPVIGIPLGIRAWRDGAGNGVMSYGRGVGAGFFISLWWALGAAVYQLLNTTVINPGQQQQIIDKQMEALEKMPAEQRQMMESIFHFMMNPAVQFISAIIFCCVFGVIIALIASAFLKREATVVTAPPPIA